MRFGLIMTVCCRQSMQEEAWIAAREMSRPDTPFLVLFNGIDPWPLPEGIQTLHVEKPYEDEADLWNYGLALAQEHGWDWIVFIHDDFKMLEPGWEASLEQSEGWRVALAGWFAYREWDEECVSHYPAPGRLATAIDPLSIGFNVRVFAERGYIAQPEFGFGFTAWEVNAWALSQGYAVWRIPLNSWHSWIPEENSRRKMGKGALGHQTVRERWRGKVLPSRVLDGEHIEVCGKKIRVAPYRVEPETIRRVESLSTDCVYVTDDKQHE